MGCRISSIWERSGTTIAKLIARHILSRTPGGGGFVAQAFVEVSTGRWTGLGDVKVVNLGDASGGKHQD